MRQGGLAALIPWAGRPCVGRGEGVVPFAPGPALSGLAPSFGCWIIEYTFSEALLEQRHRTTLNWGIRASCWEPSDDLSVRWFSLIQHVNKSPSFICISIDFHSAETKQRDHKDNYLFVAKVFLYLYSTSPAKQRSRLGSNRGETFRLQPTEGKASPGKGHSTFLSAELSSFFPPFNGEVCNACLLMTLLSPLLIHWITLFLISCAHLSLFLGRATVM